MIVRYPTGFYDLPENPSDSGKSVLVVDQEIEALDQKIGGLLRERKGHQSFGPGPRFPDRRPGVHAGLAAGPSGRFAAASVG